MATTTVVIHDYRADKDTGRIELHLKCRNTDGTATWDGPIRQYTCDPQTLRDRFCGEIEQFEQWAASQHKQVTGVTPGLHEKLQAKRGKVIG